MNGSVLAVLGAGTVVVALITAAGLRSEGNVRRGILASALAYAVWTAGTAGLFLGLPEGWFWGLVRPLVIVLFGVGTSVAPGTSRAARELAVVLLDGAMTVLGALGAFWILAHWQTVLPDRAGICLSTLWLPAQCALLIPVAGMIPHIERGRRLPSLTTLMIGVLVLAGDVFALTVGDPRIGAPFWLAGGLGLALSLLVLGTEPFAEVFPDASPKAFQWWQLPIPLAVTYLLLKPVLDLPLQLGLATVAAVLFAELVFHSHRNERLWLRLAERNRRYEQLLNDSQDGIVQVDEEGLIEFASPAAERLLSVPGAELIGSRLRDWAHPEDRDVGFGRARAFDWSRASSFTTVVRYPVPGGSLSSVEWTVSRRRSVPGAAVADEKRNGWIMVGRDVSERIRLQENLTLSARTDTLTGLLNRGAFLEEAEARLAGGPGAAVLFLDLDHFKEVNDTLGHPRGDELLRRAAECLRQAVGKDDLVARLGGDEFAVLLETTDRTAAETVAQSVITAFNGFDEAAAGRPSVAASVGVAITGAGTADELLRDADLAMYRAKQRGGADSEVFEPWMSEQVLERSRMRADLEQAVRREALALHLQPVVRLHTGEWAGFEALIRWPHGAQTWRPDQFLPIAEESGLIVPMGAWVVREAVRQLARWDDPAAGMAVNVSAQQLVGTDLYDVVMSALAAAGVAPGRLTVEITEQAAVQDLGRTASRLDALRDEGVHVAIDDFGTGFSSLQYLSRLPVDILKIDRKFVSGLGQHPEDDVLVRSMIGLAADLGLDVIAEGVENEDQAERLREYGCRLAQGFLYSPPRALEELRATARGELTSSSIGVVPGPRREPEGPLSRDGQGVSDDETQEGAIDTPRGRRESNRRA